MRLDVEAHQVGAQQTFQELALPRADAERFRIRPGNVPENRDARIGPRFLDEPRHQSEVVVLDQHHRILLAANLA